jgi:hypothetical protein
MGESGCLSTTQMGKVPDYVRIILVKRNAQVVKYVQRYTILFWQDLWNERLLQNEYPELYSFATNKNIKIKKMLESEALEDNFHLLLSEIAYNQFCELDNYMQSIQPDEDKDTWTYIWGTRNYSTSKAYKHLIASQFVHLAFKWLWTSSCQLKHKIFY